MAFAEPCAGGYGVHPLVVEAPVVIPWAYGLLSVATVIDEGDDHARNGIFYKSPACTADVLNWEDDCDSGEVADKVPTFTGDSAFIQGCPFHLYAALDCKTTTLEAMGAEVRTVFELGEQRAIETEVWNRVLATGATTVLNATSLPADAFTVTGGIAALESHMASLYGGRATLHSDRGVAAYAAQNYEIQPGGRIKETVLGSAWAFYGGSPNTSPAGVAAPSGYAWMYATSQLVIRRFPVDVLPDETNQRIRYNPLTNEPYVLAERTYVPSVECVRAAVLVCLSC